MKALSVLGLVLLLTVGCGDGPSSDGTMMAEQDLPLSNVGQPIPEYQRSGTSDYQRPVADSQNRPGRDEQSLSEAPAQLLGEPGSSDDACELLCAATRERGCGGGCRQICDVWFREGGAECIGILQRVVECVLASSLDCADATEVCGLEFSAEAERCPDPSE